MLVTIGQAFCWYARLTGTEVANCQRIEHGRLIIEGYHAKGDVLPYQTDGHSNTKSNLATRHSIGTVKGERTRIFIFWSLLFLLLLPMHVSAAAHQVTQWADNRAGAVSITFDDGFRSQYTMAVPALNARGFKGSFFLITDIVDHSLNNSYYASLDEWRNVCISRP